MVKIATEAALPSSEPMAVPRWLRRLPTDAASRLAARAVTLSIRRRAAMRTSAAMISTSATRSASRIGPARYTLVMSAAWVLCDRSQTSRQAMPGAALWQALESVGALATAVTSSEAATRPILISRLAQFRTPFRYQASPVWAAVKASSSAASATVRLTALAPCPTFASRRSRIGRSAAGALVACCSSAQSLRACSGSTRVSPSNTVNRTAG